MLDYLFNCLKLFLKQNRYIGIKKIKTQFLLNILPTILTTEKS